VQNQTAPLRESCTQMRQAGRSQYNELEAVEDEIRFS
jgi:hypothetical protein